MKIKEEKNICKITNFLKQIQRLLQDPHNIQDGNLPDISPRPKDIK